MSNDVFKKKIENTLNEVNIQLVTDNITLKLIYKLLKF